MASLTLTPKGFRAALPLGLPDLVVQSVSSSPASPVAGDHVVFSAVVKNQGDSPTPAGVGIGLLFSIDSNPVSWTTDTSGALEAGGTRTITATAGTSGGDYWVATLGSHELLVNVNDALTISETITVNNTLDENVSVGANTVPSSSTWGPTGKNGTRWPVNTPTWNQSVPNSVEVDCTWAAIKTGIQSFTAAQVAAGARVMVRPGTLPGNGYGSTATPVIQDVGSTSWAKRVLVRPRDGFGTVTVGNLRVFRAHGVTWAGFTGGGWRLDSSINAGQAWIESKGGTITWYTTEGEPDMTGLHVVEVVQSQSFMRDADSTDCWVKGGNMVSPVFEGLYLAPAWRAAGSTQHSDTLQFEPFNGAVVTNATLRDCVMFGSRNAVIQINALRTATIDHCYLAARGYCLTRYPIPSGGDPTTSSAWALNGGHGTPALTVKDSAIMGQWKLDTDGGPAVSTVTNTISTVDYSSSWPGDYIVHTNLTDDNFNTVTGLSKPGTPGVDYRLSDIWTT